MKKVSKVVQVLVLLLVACNTQAQYKSLLWKISGNGLKDTSYLYGTMHTADSRIIDMSNRAMPYFNNSKAYAMEIDPDGDKNMMGLMSKMMMGKDHSLQKMIPAKEYSYLDSICTSQIGVPMIMFDNVSPVIIMTIFEGVSMGLDESSVTGKVPVLDLYFHDQAKKAKKKVIGIESISEQLSALNTLSYQEQADMLKEEVDSFQVNKNGGSEVLKYYLDQDLDSLSTSDDDAKKSEKFYKALVVDRNARMANRMAEFIKKQSTFIAIGALHLPGDIGVIALLRKKGFTVEPVL
jgi:uncharacterized protein YbaP (TraB family)